MNEDELAWSVNSREIAYSCPGFDVIHEEVTLPDGTKTDFDFLREPPSVVILPFTTDGDVVVIDEWRQAVKRVNTGIPAGTADPADPDLARTARRELREETGYEPGRLEALGGFEPANGLADIRHHFFVAHGCERAGPPDHDADESIRVRVVAYEALLSDALDGSLEDGRTVLGLLYHRATTTGG